MIKACIFDLGGTIVDRYSLTSLLSLKKLFLNRGITLPMKHFLNDNKRGNILNILNDEIISKKWLKRYNDYPDDFDVKILFNEFDRYQSELSENVIDILPETKECIHYLNFNYIKTGCTTDFNEESVKHIKNKLDQNYLFFDSYVPHIANKPSRPNPYMIHENMNLLGISNPKEVMKIDDSILGIEEGKNAGCITVGVARWSIHMNIMSLKDSYEIGESEIREKLKHSRNVLREGGADYVIDTLEELPRVIESINYK